MANPRAESRWRGWEDGPGGPGVVTSARLGADAGVRNRAFPKIRSWFALGAPFELLSPLSVARVLVVLWALCWPTVWWVDRSVSGAVVAAVLAVTGATLILLLRVRELGHAGCHALVAGAMVATSLLVWAGGADPVVCASVVLLVPALVFAGVFLPARSLPVHAVVVAIGVGAATLVAQGPARAAWSGLAVGVSVLGAGLTVALVSGSARRRTTVDPDTGLPNGYGLADRLARWADDGPYVVATVLLRGLGDAREALGYQVGTELLRRAVEDLGQVLPADARIGRVDGDELVVARPVGDAAARDPDGEAAAVALAGHLAEAIGAGRYLVGGVEISLRAHVGLAVAPEDGHDVTELVRRASLSARRALASGQPYARWDGANGAMTAASLALLADLRLAPERDELWLAYQPQIDPASGRAVSVESLIRWTSERHGTVPPSVFVPLAERTGLIDRLTEWVLGEALDAQVRWRDVGLRLPVSVNISPLSLSDAGLAARILGELRRRELRPEVLTVEVTETAAVDLVHAVEGLRPLHECGVRVSIDDFGSGYTSLSVLPHLPLDELKVDQRFVRNSSVSPADEAIVQSVRELAHRLGFHAVAEGVEDGEISARMRAFGFDLLQGYHYAPPLTELDLLDYVTRNRRRAAGRADGRPLADAARAAD